jgi:hypothetical protein
MKTNQNPAISLIVSNWVGALSLALSLFFWPGVARAEQKIFEDYSAQGTKDFLEQLNMAADRAGLGAWYFGGDDETAIRNAVQADLQSVYGAFTVNFGTANPGADFTTVQFAPADLNQRSSTFTNYGTSPFDYRNKVASQVCRVYTYNFDFALNGVSKASDIANISAALAGTAAHELGHSFGLDHRDTYGDPRITPAKYANTERMQNQHIRATGSTGLKPKERAGDRTLSQMEMAELEFGAGLTASPAPR